MDHAEPLGKLPQLELILVATPEPLAAGILGVVAYTVVGEEVDRFSAHLLAAYGLKVLDIKMGIWPIDTSTTYAPLHSEAIGTVNPHTAARGVANAVRLLHFWRSRSIASAIL